MKTSTTTLHGSAAPIVQLTDESIPGAQAGELASPATADDALRRARNFAEPLLTGQILDTGEPAMSHADGVAAILADIGAAPGLSAAAYLVYAGDFLQRPEEVVSKAFGPAYASLVTLTRQLVRIQRAARDANVELERRAQQTERVRKMLLAFSRDMRVVLLRLASRLQTLRWHAQSKVACPGALARESQQVFAPLANRLGIWQIKWEIEDLSFRFLQPDDYRRVAAMLDSTRMGRENDVEAFRSLLMRDMAAAGIDAQVHGRPKHIYSIWKKMQGKRLDFGKVFDVRALRVIVPDVPSCYAALSRVHERFRPVAGEFDDYIARPKANGYQSLHTVILDDDGAAVEVQIRTEPMHEHAEYGVAAHWAYKEAGTKGYAGVQASGSFEDRVAEARKAVLRQLLAWEREFASGGDEPTQDAGAPASSETPVFDDRIYVFTPQAAVIELTAGATPIDFAYALHSDLGHRCRGAKVDGVMVSLNTPLANGQTVEVISIKEGGPSLDWLNAELGYLKSPRSKSKVRAWFNTQAQAQTIARGRELVERLLQREGRTALKLDELAAQLGFKGAEALFTVVGKDEFSLRNIEQLLRPAEPAPVADEMIGLRRPSTESGKGGVLVVGVESLLTTLARCCRPAPPDAIVGFVTRSKGVAIHRKGCSNVVHMAARSPDRVIPVAWGSATTDKPGAYPVDLMIEAGDRPGLLRDISEAFTKEKVNVVGARTQTVKDARGVTAWMTFTVEVADAHRLKHVLAQIARIDGVRRAGRK